MPQGIIKYGLHPDPSNNALCVETDVPRRETILQRFDTAPPLTATLYDAEGNVIDLTGATVTFGMRYRRSREDKILNAPASILDAPNGRVQYQWLATDTDQPGYFDAHFRVTYPGGQVESFPNWKSHEVQIQP